MAMSNDEVLQQSNSAFNQWRDLWDSHALRHKAIHDNNPTSHRDLIYKGYGKNLLCVAMGPSLEDEIDFIAENKDKFDIACVDKAFQPLMEKGIKPTYVFVADAKVSFDVWCKDHAADTEGIILVSSVTANPEWAEAWKGPVYYYVNKDNIKTEERYAPMSGVREMIPAGSNVGNSIVIFAPQVLEYDNYFLIGYDFCWGDDDNYYAFHDNNKRYAMKHHYMVDNSGRLVNTSGNLWFSCRWLQDFINQYHKHRPIFNCSKGLFNNNNTTLAKALGFVKQRKLSEDVINAILKGKTRKKVFTIKDGEGAVQQALKDLQVASVEINYIPEDALYGFAV